MRIRGACDTRVTCEGLATLEVGAGMRWSQEVAIYLCVGSRERSACLGMVVGAGHRYSAVTISINPEQLGSRTFLTFRVLVNE